jgi:hypothetical protein
MNSGVWTWVEFFGIAMQRLLIIESFFKIKINKIINRSFI